MAAIKLKFGRAIRLGLVELALMLLGMLFVRREIWQMHAMSFTVPNWQEGLLIPLAAIDGMISGGLSSRRRHVQNTPSYKNLLRFGTPLFFFLYVACSALCERISVGLFPTSINATMRTIAIVIVVSGMVLRIAAQSSSPIDLAPSETAPESESETPQIMLPPTFPSGPHKWIRHPDAAGRLVSLLGLPLVFNAWLPLLALPGIVTLLKWHISDQEAFRISQLGEPYLEYRKKTWNLIPYLY